METIMRYRAIDGKEFEHELDCLNYERFLTKSSFDEECSKVLVYFDHGGNRTFNYDDATYIWVPFTDKAKRLAFALFDRQVKAKELSMNWFEHNLCINSFDKKVSSGLWKFEENYMDDDDGSSYCRIMGRNEFYKIAESHFCF